MCVRALHFVGFLLDNVSALRNSSSSLQNKVIECQQQVISAQAELSDCKSEKLETLKQTLETSVVDSVKVELQSYSAAVQKSLPSCGEPIISKETLKSVVKDVVNEEDRSRNIVVFGLSEEEGEELNDRVGEVFQSIGQKPRIEAVRVGLKKGTDSIRPVKVTVSSSAIVDQIVGNGKKLRQLEKFRTVFVCPDRSPEQRKIQRDLVKIMKERALSETGLRFFIRSGEIHSVARTVK